MNFIWESWLRNRTDTRDEAIVNSVQGKGVEEYRALLTRAFRECRRVLRDNAWMTVVFHNSSGEVWAALQDAICEAGFVVCGTQTFDKAHGTFKQFVSDNAVGYDIVLHCRKSDSVAPRQTAPEFDLDVATFVCNRIQSNPTPYRVRYLHVTRPDEWDYRKLYSEWLAESLVNNGSAIGFEEFRMIAIPLLGKLERRVSQTFLF